MMMVQYWLGKTKPKQAFRSTQKCFQKLAMEFKIQNFLLTNCLPDAFGYRNSTMAKGTDLICSLFDITSARGLPFGIPQYIRFILHELTGVLLCVPFIIADCKKCRFDGIARDDPLLCVTEIVCIFHIGYFGYI